MAALITMTVQSFAAKLDLKSITRGEFRAESMASLKPLDDGESYSQVSSDGTKILKYSFKTGKQTGVIFDLNNVRGPKIRIDRIDGYIFSPDGKRILIQTDTRYIYRRSFTATYYIYEVQNNKMGPLSVGGEQQTPLFSPDGNMIAFVRQNNIFLVKLLYDNAESQVTTDGERNSIINGIPDWVYEEEFSTNRSMVFTADSRQLVWIKYDESKVKEFSFQWFRGSNPTMDEYLTYPGSYIYKYPKAGEDNSKVGVYSFDIKSRKTRQIDVPLDADGYIPRIVATSDPTKLAVVTLNRHQDEMNLYMVNPLSGNARLAVKEHNDRYLRESAYTALRFYKDGFAMLSERTGYQHLYWYNLNGQLLRTVTKGDFEVSAFYGYDAATQSFYYASHEDGPLQTTICRADRSGRVTRLSAEKGQNSAVFSKSLKYFMNVWSNLDTPPVTTLRDGNGKRLATLIDNASLKQKVDAFSGQRELFSFVTPDGVQLNGWMVKPRNFDASKR